MKQNLEMTPVLYTTRILSIFCLATLLLKTASTENVDFYIHSNCSECPRYKQGSEYQTNLYYVLSNITSNSDTSKFYNFTSGKSPNKVYGLFLCNIYLDNELCQNCITTAVAEIQQRCPSSIQAIIWRAVCMLRYSNHSIFSLNDVSIFYKMEIGPTKYLKFNQQVSNIFISLLDMAITTRNLAATTIARLDQNTLVNPYVDCTPDLSPSDCRSCLQSALSRLEMVGHQEEILVQPSCRLDYAFIDSVGSSLPEGNQQSILAVAKRLYVAVGVISALALTSFLIILYIFVICWKRRKVMRKPTGIKEIESTENLHIQFDAVKAATDNFSEANKLGQGGFGIVYMGTLADGQAVAVKRLSNVSGQGIREFKTEASLVAKLQHKNLVKVYGFCLEGNEKLLIYELVPNKSLDRFLFDAKRGAYLKWETRHMIIMGIARGLLYLHEDSRPKIIHRDLKSSNILLDEDMNPKISDFGMAKLFGGEQTQGNTSRVAGTFGYMAPEYVTTGHFSAKSDIFSYGVILLELVSGKRNSRWNSNADDFGNLLSYAWRLWNEGNHLKLVDSAIGNDFSEGEVERCIHVGLLCTQEDPARRPNIASVLLMLNIEPIPLPPPTSPPLFPYNQEMPVDSHGSYGIQAVDIISDLSPR